MEHILETIFALPPDTVLHCALSHNGYAYPEDILMERSEILDELEYPDSNGMLLKILENAA